MAEYTLSLARIAGSYDGTAMVMVKATITISGGRFQEVSKPLEAIASDGASSVRSFMSFISPNGKELYAYFTTDGLAVFTGPFSLTFGPMGSPMGTIENVVPASIDPLSATYASLNLPNADNAWLATLG